MSPQRLAHHVGRGADKAAVGQGVHAPDALLLFAIVVFERFVQRALVAQPCATHPHDEAAQHLAAAVAHHAVGHEIAVEITPKVERRPAFGMVFEPRAGAAGQCQDQGRQASERADDGAA
jgi:hypothetical protein